MSRLNALRSMASKAFQYVKPDSKLEAITALAPDLLFSGIGAMALPEDVSAADRALYLLGDAGLGLTASFGGLAAGRAAANRLIKGVGETADAKRQGIRFAADFLAGTVPMAASYAGMLPHENYVFGKLNEERSRQEQELLQAQLQAQQAQLDGLNLLSTGAGGLLLI